MQIFGHIISYRKDFSIWIDDKSFICMQDHCQAIISVNLARYKLYPRAGVMIYGIIYFQVTLCNTNVHSVIMWSACYDVLANSQD